MGAPQAPDPDDATKQLRSQATAKRKAVDGSASSSTVSSVIMMAMDGSANSSPTQMAVYLWNHPTVSSVIMKAMDI